MILVYLEQNADGTLPKGTLVAISAALDAKGKHGYGKAVGLFIGDSSVELSAKSAATFGLDEVCFVKNDLLKNYLAGSYANVLEQVVSQVQPKLVLGLASTRGKDLFPRVAGKLNAGQASDILEFLPGGNFKRPMYAGNIIAEVSVNTPLKFATIRGTAFSPAVASATSSSVRELSCTVAAPKGQEFVEFQTAKSERPELTEAAVVISAGRAFKSAENIEKYISPLADLLGAAVGASRAAVDSGYAPNDWQVGQTGKVVAPNLYIAVGISGAIQHLAGMKDSKVIVAINKDPEAPIFEVADYGLVGDLFEILPQLTEEIKKQRS